MNFTENIHNHHKAGYPALWVQTFEERRMAVELFHYFKKSDVRVLTWDISNGLSERKVTKKGEEEEFFDGTDQYKDLITKLASWAHTRCLFILRDFHPYLESPKIIRDLRNALNDLKGKQNMIIFSSPITKVPVELEKEIQFIEFTLPSEEAIGRRLEFIKQSAETSKGNKLELTPEISRSAINAAKGMTDTEVENAFALSLISTAGKFDTSFVKSVFDEKIEKIKNNGLLTYIEPNLSFDDVGGLDGLKQWIKIRAKAYLPEAQAYGLVYPKGVLLSGFPGTGKTLIAKATAKELNVPLFQLDVGGLFGKYIGESEANFRKVIQIVDAIGPCILFLDEIEKSLNRDAVGGKSDSGTSSRSFGTLLTWMSDRKTPVFVIGTSNNHTILPPELVRKGRFDELFFLGLPGDQDRESIFNVILARYKRDPKKFDVAKLSEHTKGFTGSEIEQLVQSSMFTRFAANGEDITTKDIIEEAEDFKPQSVTSKIEFDEIAEKAKGKMRPAASLSFSQQTAKVYRKLTI